MTGTKRSTMVIEKEKVPLILAAGMPRSGSTWLFNAIRLLLENQSVKVRSGWYDDVKESIGAEPLLVKIHDFDSDVVASATSIFYSFRDLRDAMASAKRKFGREPTVEHARRLIDAHGKWVSVADYRMRYESMREDPTHVIVDIAATLGYTIDEPTRIDQEIRTLSYDSAGEKNGTYNTVNLIHRDHITNGSHGAWASELSSSFVDQLETEFPAWFSENGYQVRSRTSG